jgi:hypothetical protein
MTLRYSICLLIGFASLILLAGLFQYQRLSATIVIIAVLWIVGVWRGWKWSGHVGFYSLSLTAVIGILEGQALAVMFFSQLLALLAWDLSFLDSTTTGVETRELNIIIRSHIYRVLVVLIAGLILSSIALSVDFQLTPLGAILVGVFVLYGLSRTVRFLRRSTD